MGAGDYGGAGRRVAGGATEGSCYLSKGSDPVEAVTWALCSECGRPGLRLLTARHECLPEIEQAHGSHDGGDSEAAERELAPDAIVAHHLWIPRDQHHQDQRDRCREPAGEPMRYASPAPCLRIAA